MKHSLRLGSLAVAAIVVACDTVGSATVLDAAAQQPYHDACRGEISERMVEDIPREAMVVRELRDLSEERRHLVGTLATTGGGRVSFACIVHHGEAVLEVGLVHISRP